MSTDEQHGRGLGELDRLGAWTEEEAAEFELARQALNAVIAAYSGRIAAAGPDEAARLRAEQARYLAERRTLVVADRDAVQRIRRDYPALASRVATGES